MTLPLRCALTLSLLAPLLSVAGARAQEEVRDMSIQVDGKRAGQSHVAVQPLKDGATTVSISADVAVDALLFRYRYVYHGTEVWKDGKLQKLESKTNENGKRLSVSAVVAGDAIKMKTGNGEHLVNADTWTNSYLCYPDFNRCNKTVEVLEADNGKQASALMQYVGKDQVMVAGTRTNCDHFRLSGGLTADLWYDGKKRLVRQESMESGHRLLIEMVGVHH